MAVQSMLTTPAVLPPGVAAGVAAVGGGVGGVGGAGGGAGESDGGGVGGVGGGDAMVVGSTTSTMIFWPELQWLPIWHAKYTTPGCVSTTLS